MHTVIPRITQEIADEPSLLREAEWEMVARELELSPRELQIVRHVFIDEKEQAVATRLGISTHTVHTHLRRMYWKLGVNSRAALAVRVFRAYVAIVRQGRLPLMATHKLAVRRAAA